MDRALSIAQDSTTSAASLKTHFLILHRNISVLFFLQKSIPVSVYGMQIFRPGNEIIHFKTKRLSLPVNLRQLLGKTIESNLVNQ